MKKPLVLNKTAKTNHDDNKRAVVAANGIEEILNMMRSHQNSVKVQEMGCGALDNIGWSNGELRKKIKDSGAVAVVEAAIADHFVGATAACKHYGRHLLVNLECA